MNPSLNQPVLFTQTTPLECCPDGLEWKQRIHEGDPVRWQFKVDPCINAVEVMESPNFEVPGDWLTLNADISGGICSMPDNGSRIAQLQAPALNVGDWFQIEVVVENATLDASGSTLEILGFDGIISFSASEGMFIFYGQVLNPIIELIHTFDVSVSENIVLNISKFSVLPLQFPVATIERTDGSGDLDIVFGSSLSNAFILWEYVPSQTVLDEGEFRIRVDRDCDGSVETWTSEDICILPINSCDLMIGACANTNVWGAGFQPLIRVAGELKIGTGYKYNRVLNESNNGIHSLVYGRRTKSSELVFDLMPDHVRDFLYYLAMSGEIAIRLGNGPVNKYFLLDEPDDPEFPEGEKHLAMVRMSVVYKERLEETIFAGQCSVSIPPVVIGDEVGRAIADENNGLINA